ncbi:hypothetical protein M0811_02496 [Anaeramoeba ignava]|uniref:Uncharacterized protein n=1 Tax=Anaeramoeba ignava TaxID=1746090 RepID=A0A9Q0LA19_ANAIG|nr:hypothetical protein M0811_02496 [Anaeramoeba ignava]
MSQKNRKNEKIYEWFFKKTKTQLNIYAQNENLANQLVLLMNSLQPLFISLNHGRQTLEIFHLFSQFYEEKRITENYLFKAQDIFAMKNREKLLNSINELRKIDKDKETKKLKDNMCKNTKKEYIKKDESIEKKAKQKFTFLTKEKFYKNALNSVVNHFINEKASFNVKIISPIFEYNSNNQTQEIKTRLNFNADSMQIFIFDKLIINVNYTSYFPIQIYFETESDDKLFIQIKKNIPILIKCKNLIQKFTILKVFEMFYKYQSINLFPQIFTINCNKILTKDLEIAALTERCFKNKYAIFENMEFLSEKNSQSITVELNLEKAIILFFSFENQINFSVPFSKIPIITEKLGNNICMKITENQSNYTGNIIAPNHSIHDLFSSCLEKFLKFDLSIENTNNFDLNQNFNQKLNDDNINRFGCIVPLSDGKMLSVNLFLKKNNIVIKSKDKQHKIIENYLFLSYPFCQKNSFTVDIYLLNGTNFISFQFKNQEKMDDFISIYTELKKKIMDSLSIQKMLFLSEQIFEVSFLTVKLTQIENGFIELKKDSLSFQTKKTPLIKPISNTLLFYEPTSLFCRILCGDKSQFIFRFDSSKRFNKFIQSYSIQKKTNTDFIRSLFNQKNPEIKDIYHFLLMDEEKSICGGKFLLKENHIFLMIEKKLIQIPLFEPSFSLELHPENKSTVIISSRQTNQLFLWFNKTIAEKIHQNVFQIIHQINQYFEDSKEIKTNNEKNKINKMKSKSNSFIKTISNDKNSLEYSQEFYEIQQTWGESAISSKSKSKLKSKSKSKKNHKINLFKFNDIYKLILFGSYNSHLKENLLDLSVQNNFVMNPCIFGISLIPKDDSFIQVHLKLFEEGFDIVFISHKDSDISHYSYSNPPLMELSIVENNENIKNHDFNNNNNTIFVLEISEHIYQFVMQQPTQIITFWKTFQMLQFYSQNINKIPIHCGFIGEEFEINALILKFWFKNSVSFLLESSDTSSKDLPSKLYLSRKTVSLLLQKKPFHKSHFLDHNLKMNFTLENSQIEISIYIKNQKTTYNFKMEKSKANLILRCFYIFKLLAYYLYDSNPQYNEQIKISNKIKRNQNNKKFLLDFFNSLPNISELSTIFDFDFDFDEEDDSHSQKIVDPKISNFSMIEQDIFKKNQSNPKIEQIKYQKDQALLEKIQEEVEKLWKKPPVVFSVKININGKLFSGELIFGKKTIKIINKYTKSNFKTKWKNGFETSLDNFDPQILIFNFGKNQIFSILFTSIYHRKLCSITIQKKIYQIQKK